MKKQIILTLIICAIAGFSCNTGESLSEKRAKERAAIAKLIADSAYVVMETMPIDTIFKEKEFYHSSSGLYIHIENKGEGRKPQTGDKVIFGYYLRTLEGVLVESAMNSEDRYLYDYKMPEIKFNSAEVSRGLNEILGYLGKDGEAYAIVPSAIGEANAQSNIIPYIYEIRLKLID